jgi:non-ribosomal peptide synthase protein (TIGR01720 family)
MIFEVEGLSSAVLKQALILVLMTNPVLRHSFHRDENGTLFEKVEELNNDDILDFIDLSDHQEKSHAIEKISNEYQKTLIFSKKLYRFIYFKLGEGLPSRFLFIVHHGLFDLFSATILMEEISEYVNLIRIGETTLPQQKKCTSIEELGDYIYHYANSTKGQEEAKYWLSQPWGSCTYIMDYPESFLANQTNENIDKGNIVRSQHKIGDGCSIKLIDLATRDENKISISEVVYTVFGLVIHRMTNNRHVSFDVVTNGRMPNLKGIDLSTTIGWIAHSYPIAFEIEDAADFAGSIQTLRNQLRNVPNSGIGFNSLKYLSTSKEIRNEISDIKQPEILVNYIPPELTLFAAKSLVSDPSGIEFILGKESPGRTQPPYDECLFRSLHAIIWFENGELTLNLEYRDNVFTEKTINRLTTLWKNEIEKIVNLL